MLQTMRGKQRSRRSGNRKQTEQNVLRTDTIVTGVPSLRLRVHDHRTSLIREPFEHAHTPPHRRPRRASPEKGW